MTVELLKNLGNYKLFDGIEAKDLLLFKDLIEIKSYDKDSVIITENEDGSFIFLLLEGEVEITQALTLAMDKDNNNEIDTREKAFTRLSHSMHPFIGEMSLFDTNQKRSATVKALTHCSIAVINNNDLLNLCDKYMHIGYKIMQNIAKKLNSDLRQANQNVLKLTTALNFVLE